MREIKFRAWDGERLRKVNTIGWVDEDMDFVTTPRYSGPAEDFRLMQYTGIKDKKGVEIYVGDIVKHFNKKYEVVKHFNGKYVGKRNEFAELDIVIAYTSPECEVIGNIYEDSNLIK